MKKNLIVIGLSFVLLGCGNSQEKDKIIESLNLEIKELNLENKNLQEELEFSSLPDSYIVNAKQIGGVGVKIVQANARLETEHGYLSPIEDYYTYSFNSPGDVIHLGCGKNYYLNRCGFQEGEKIDIKNDICSSSLKNEIQNNFYLRCIKDYSKKPNK